MHDVKRFAMVLLLAGCVAPPPTLGEQQSAVTDERWWKNPLFPGSTPYNYADGHTWYDSDIGGSYVTGSYVRLPVDANYIADWSVGPVYCNGGGTRYFWSPVFQTTVNGKTTNWVFNHLSQSYLGANGRTKGWYNGGALVGLTGGGTCDTGYPTYSSGPHFCNEMRDYDPYTYWSPVADYTSGCGGSNGTSGVANPVCGGVSNDPCRGATLGNGGYCGAGLPGGDPNKLYTCQGGVTASATACACGCQQNPPGTSDACKTGCSDPCASAKYGNGGYCGGGLTGGDPNLLYACSNGVTMSKTTCKCGCTVEPPGTNDFCAMMCATPADLSSGPYDMSPVPGQKLLIGEPDLGAAADASGKLPQGVHGGCSLAPSAPAPSLPPAALLLAALLLLLRRARPRPR